MRIVQFDNTPNWPDVVYPEEGASAFGKTVRIGDDVVGEYNGAATDPTLPDYPGVWPIPLPPETTTNVENYRAFDPLVGLTGAEQEALANSTDDDVIAGYGSLRLRPMIDLTDPEVQALLQLFVDDSDITPARFTELTTVGVRTRG